MPPFCLDGSLLGTERHLVVSDDGYRWSRSVPGDAWHLDGSLKPRVRCLDTALKLSGLDVKINPDDAFVNAVRLLNLDPTQVPWQRFMPQRMHRSFVKKLVDEVGVAMAATPLDYFEGIWSAGSTVLGSLVPATIDSKKLQHFIDEGAGNVPALRSFVPEIGELAREVAYDRFKTLTGRLTVAAGPQILTLKKEHRSIIRSSHGDAGTVMSLDFAALEARVLLYEHGGRCDDVDLYGSLAAELGYDRRAVKGAVISELYGSSRRALGQQLGISGEELISFAQSVKDRFQTNDLLERIKKQFLATGRVVNRYGRHVAIDDPLDHVMISYYSQSTGVDVTMLGFKQVLERLTNLAPRTRAIFLLHDAMLLDVPNDEVAAVETIRSVKVRGYVQAWPLKLEVV